MTRQQFLALAERYLKRNDLADLYSDFLKMAEARINAVMRLSEMEQVEEITPTAPLWPFPDDFLELRHIQATAASGSRPVEYVTPEQATIKRRLLTRGGGNYAFYTIVDGLLELIPHPGPDSETPVELYYYGKVSALETQASTNPVVTNYPNLYLYAFLGEAALYREAQELANQWLGSFDAYADQLNTRAQAGRFSGNSMQMRVV